MEHAIQKQEIICRLCGKAESQFFLRKNNCDIYTCTSCGSKFVSPIPSSTEIYSEDYFTGAGKGFGYTNYDADKQVMVPVFEDYMRQIIALRPSKGMLFDIGAATGFFLAIAGRFGFEVAGVEISDFAASAARAKGIDVATGTLETISDVSERYDVVTMLDVIEHVADPRVELSRVHTLLKPNGLLVINTPDVGSLYARLLGRGWHLLVPPEHLYYFNRSTMRTVLEESGYRVLVVKTIGKKFTLPYIFKTLYMWQRLGVWKWLLHISQHTWLRSIALPVNLFDNMFVIAEKV